MPPSDVCCWDCRSIFSSGSARGRTAAVRTILIDRASISPK
jgi:hypothetical protein